MEIRCIDNLGYESRLTKDKIYKVEDVSPLSYMIIDDTGKHTRYGKKNFSVHKYALV